jgi:hypothetical protein
LLSNLGPKQTTPASSHLLPPHLIFQSSSPELANHPPFPSHTHPSIFISIDWFRLRDWNALLLSYQEKKMKTLLAKPFWSSKLESRVSCSASSKRSFFFLLVSFYEFLDGNFIYFLFSWRNYSVCFYHNRLVCISFFFSFQVLKFDQFT